MAVITGTNVNETLTGTSGDDQIYGYGGDDSLSGGAGNDELDGGTGADTMTGGSGNDLYHVDDAGDVVIESSGGGTDTVRITISSYTLGSNVEHLDARYVSAASMSLAGNALSNIFYMGAGAVTVSAGSGNDTANYSAASGYVSVDLVSHVHGGEAADDSLTSIENLTGSAYDDDLHGTSGANVLDGGAGDDMLVGRGGNDVYIVDSALDNVVELSGQGTDEVRTALSFYQLHAEVERLRYTGSGSFQADGNDLNNEIWGGAIEDVLSGGDGHDNILGGGGDDILYGGAGHDTLQGQTGADYMEGGAGNDVYIIDNSGDWITEYSGDGTDEVYVTLSDYMLPDEVENARYNANSGDFNVTGNSADNVIQSGSGNDVLTGMAGNDELRGGGGNDTLYGDDGDDLLIGQSGADTFDGGIGADVLRIGYWDSGVGVDADTVYGFEQGLDLIDVSGWDADMTTAGNQAFAFIGNAAFGNVAGELRYAYDGVAFTVVEADYDGDAVADFQIFVYDNLALTASDFAL